MLIKTSADVLARAAYNAMLYCPKPSPWDMSLVVVNHGIVSFLTSTQSYTLAWSALPADTPSDLVDGIGFKISRSDLAALEERARKGQKEFVSLEFDLDSHEIWYRGEDPALDLRMDDIFVDGIEPESWDELSLDAFRELISERETDPLLRRVILATEYIRKLGQVRKEDKNIGADFCFAGEDDPVLVRVGEWFRLIIEPIDRERHRRALGEGVTW